MDGEVKNGTTVAGKRNYTVTVGTNTYVTTDWSKIIDILTYHKDDLAAQDAGYGKGVYSGD